MAENELDSISEKGLDDLRKIVALTHSNLEKISRILDNIDKEKRKEQVSFLEKRNYAGRKNYKCKK